jgi:hypothetical protein
MIPRSHHDMGGLPAGKVEPTEHRYADWEQRVDALVMLMRRHGLTVDESRKNIEALPPQDYDRMAYYEKWVASLAQTLIQRGIITSDELGRKMEEVEKRLAKP